MCGRRDLLWSIADDTAQDLIIKDCHYCGCQSKAITKPNNKFCVVGLNGLDRIDSSLGYTVENCVPCCTNCNRAKAQMSLDAFREWLQKAYTHFCSPPST